MGEERRLDLERTDPIPGREDQVVVASLVPEVAVFVLADDVSRRPPLVLERFAVEVPAEEGWAAGALDLQLALDGPHLEARQWPAHRAITHLVPDQDSTDVAGLGLAVAVADVEAEPV